MYGNENGQYNQNTHQNTGAGTGQDPTFSDLMLQLMRQTERYLREQYPEAYQQQSTTNNKPSAPPAPDQGADQQHFNNNASAPPQQGQDRCQQQYSNDNNINVTPSAPQQSDQGRDHEQGPQYHQQQQQYQGQQQQQQQGSNRPQQQQQRRCDEADCQRIVQDLIKGFHTFRAIFGKTLVNVMMVVMVIWLLHLTPTFIIANVIFLIVAPSLGLSIGDMIACNLLINVINSLPTVLLAAIGYWIFHRRFIKRQPLFTCNKWEQFKRRMESYHYRQ